MSQKKKPINYGSPQFEYYNLKKTTKDFNEARKTLKNLQKIARSRLFRLERSEFSYTETVRNYKGYFNKPIKNMSEQEVLMNISETANWLANMHSSITGQRQIKEKIMHTLNEHNYGITDENYHDFAKFMETMKDKLYTEMLSSDKIADFFTQASGSDIDIKEAFSEFMEKAKHKTKKEGQIVRELMKENRKFTQEEIDYIMGVNKDEKKKKKGLKKGK